MPATIVLVHGAFAESASWDGVIDRLPEAGRAVPTLEAGRGWSSKPSHRLPWGETIDERAPLIGVPAFFGPPIIFVLAPWLLFVLLLVGPFALILTTLLVLAVALGLLTLVVAVVASPYLLVRHLRTRGMGRTKRRVALHLFTERRVSSGRLDSLQPKGLS